METLARVHGHLQLLYPNGKEDDGDDDKEEDGRKGEQLSIGRLRQDARREALRRGSDESRRLASGQ